MSVLIEFTIQLMTILRNLLKLFNKPKEKEAEDTRTLDVPTQYKLTESTYDGVAKSYTITLVYNLYTSRNWFSITMPDKEDAIELCRLLNKWANYSDQDLVVIKEIKV